MACMFFIGGGSILTFPMQRSPLALMYLTQYPCHSSISTWMPEHHSRCIKQELLSEHMFQNVFKHWGFPTIDLFASVQNAKCLQFCFRARLGPHSLGDTSLIRWNTPLLYAFLPIPLLAQVIHKIRQDRSKEILMGSMWPRQT